MLRQSCLRAESIASSRLGFSFLKLLPSVLHRNRFANTYEIARKLMHGFWIGATVIFYGRMALQSPGAIQLLMS
jgi:hypothetical protein